MHLPPVDSIVIPLPPSWLFLCYKARAYEIAHATALNELNDEAIAMGKFTINNNIGHGITSASHAMIERFGPAEACLKKLQALRNNNGGLTVQAHAGSKNDKTGMTCDDGDTNSLAVFLLGMGEGHYYACSSPAIAQGGVSAFASGLSAAEHYQTSPKLDRWDPVTWRNKLGKQDYWLHWRKEFDYPLGAPLAEASQSGAVWTRSFATGTSVSWDSGSRQGTIRWSNGVTQTGPDLTSKLATVKKQKYCGNHNDGIVYKNRDSTAF